MNRTCIQVQRTDTFVAYVDGEERKVQRTATFDFLEGSLASPVLYSSSFIITIRTPA